MIEWMKEKTDRRCDCRFKGVDVKKMDEGESKPARWVSEGNGERVDEWMRKGTE